MHLHGGIDVSLLVLGLPLLGGLRPLGDDPSHRAVELRAQREAEVVGQKDRHLLEFVGGEFLVVQRGVGLAVTAPVESVAGGLAAGGRDGAGAAEFGEGGFAVQAPGVLSEGDQQFPGTVSCPYHGWTFTNGEAITAQTFVDTWNFAANGGNGQQLGFVFGPAQLNVVGYDGKPVPSRIATAAEITKVRSGA